VPAAIGTVLLLNDPGRFLDYSGRSFTLGQRLLTELRVLWDYVASIVLPSGPRLGLVHDDYVASTGLSTPASTWIAALAWTVALAACTLQARRGRPLMLVGLLFFLAGHALESSIFPLELYFEHRNYLPSLGVLWVLAGIAMRLAEAVHDRRIARLCRIGIAALGLAYALSVLAQAMLWRDTETLLRHAAIAHPDSERAHAELAALLTHKGEADSAIEQLREAARVQPGAAHAYALAEITALCRAGREIAPELERRAAAPAGSRIDALAGNVYAQLAQQVENGACRAFGERLLAVGEQWLATDAPADSGASWQIHYRMARLHAAARNPVAALPHALAAWQGSGHELRVGLLPFQLYAALHDVDGCRRQLAELKAVDKGWDLAAGALLADFQRLVDDLGAAAPPTAAPSDAGASPR
jgi:hypothetical protein